MNWTKEGDEAKKTSIYFNKIYMRRGKEEEGKEDGNSDVAKIKSFDCILNYACIIDTTS